MEPTTPVRSSHDIVTLRNVDEEDFHFEYDRSRGNYPYVIKAGSVARYPRFLADHALRKLIDKILDKQRIKLNNEPARAELRERIFVEEEVFQQAPVDSEAERLRKEVESLNKPSDLDKVLSRSKGQQKVVEPELPLPKEEPKEEAEAFAGLDDEKKAKKAGLAGGTVDTTEPPKTESKPKAKPDRLTILKYAEDKLKLTLDAKTMVKLDKMSDDQLIEEFQYPLD